MGKMKFFKCPKCGTLLQFTVELPEDNVSWPFVIHHRHVAADGKTPCDILIGIDNNYSIREVGKEGMEEQVKGSEEQEAIEDKKMEELGFKIIRE